METVLVRRVDLLLQRRGSRITFSGPLPVQALPHKSFILPYRFLRELAYIKTVSTKSSPLAFAS